ncbi:MAG: S24 family peptidase [bacterium]|nr:S24 family peptidase [bacterium]
MKLTFKQKNILALIGEYVNQKKENPTGYGLHKSLSDGGIKDSLKSVMQVIESLEKKDLIKRDAERRIYLVENDNYANFQNIISIPLFGLASCGEALAYADDRADDFLQISMSLFPNNKKNELFAVKALGDSMNEDNLNDGDYVIFEKYEGKYLTELEGKIVVAVINGMATIKRFKRIDQNTIALFPNSTNAVHHPIFLEKSDSILIAGIFKKVLPVKYVSI